MAAFPLEVGDALGDQVVGRRGRLCLWLPGTRPQVEPDDWLRPPGVFPRP
jgi:hypothetical protein